MGKLTAKQIGENIKNIRVNGKKFQQLVHVTGLACLEQAEDHGNADFSTRLVQAVPQGMRRNALISWLEKYGKLTFNDETAKFKMNVAKVTDIAGAKAEPFWSEAFKQNEGGARAFNFSESALKLYKRAEKAFVDGDKTITQAQLDALFALLPQSAQAKINGVKAKAEPVKKAA